MSLIQHNPIVDPGEPKLSINGGKLVVRWIQRRADGKLVDCEAQVQLIGARIVRVRRQGQSEL